MRVSVCHCLACQKRTGSAFGAQARFRSEHVRIAGEARQHTRVGDEGGSARFSFCPHCGSTVFYRLDAVPGEIAVPIGAFADPDFPWPTMSVYAVRQHRWVQLSTGIEQYD